MRAADQVGEALTREVGRDRAEGHGDQGEGTALARAAHPAQLPEDRRRSRRSRPGSPARSPAAPRIAPRARSTASTATPTTFQASVTTSSRAPRVQEPVGPGVGRRCGHARRLGPRRRAGPTPEGFQSRAATPLADCSRGDHERPRGRVAPAAGPGRRGVRRRVLRPRAGRGRRARDRPRGRGLLVRRRPRGRRPPRARLRLRRRVDHPGCHLVTGRPRADRAGEPRPRRRGNQLQRTWRAITTTISWCPSRGPARPGPCSRDSRGRAGGRGRSRASLQRPRSSRTRFSRASPRWCSHLVHGLGAEPGDADLLGRDGAVEQAPLQESVGQRGVRAQVEPARRGQLVADVAAQSPADRSRGRPARRGGWEPVGWSSMAARSVPLAKAHAARRAGATRTRAPTTVSRGGVRPAERRRR